MTSWFAGYLHPGEHSSTTFTIENPSDKPFEISINPTSLSLIENLQREGTTNVKQKDAILNKTDAFIPNYIQLSDVKTSKHLGDFYQNNTIPSNSSMMILNLNFPFENFMNKTDDIYANDMKISSLYLYDWIDKNNDTDITSNELSMVNRSGSWGTVQELRISEPDKKFNGVPIVGVYPTPTRFSYWLGDTQLNSTSMDYSLSVSYYQKDKWSVIWSELEKITVPPKDKAFINVSLVVPEDFQNGVYQGFIKFEGPNHSVNAPVSFVVSQEINKKDSLVLIPGRQSDDVLYGNGYTKGAFDMSNRYMAGDWRQYYFDIKDQTINSAAIEMSWENEDTNLAVFVMDPRGKIVQTNMPSGVFGHFLAWPSIDWLGSSVFSQGGGFFPVKNKDKTSTIFYVPINQTGIYSILTHSTLFGGEAVTESITLAAKFSNISSEIQIKPDFNQTTIENLVKMDNITKIVTSLNSTTKNFTNNNFQIDDQEIDPFFNYGLVIGISIGIAIGVIVFFIFRQKTT